MNPLSLIRTYRYELVAFLTGAAVMVLEIVGARLIAPQFGMSTYVWTAMIGVILGALSLGFAIGGRLADKFHSPAFLGRLLFISAMLVLGMGLVHQDLLRQLASFELDLRLGALLAALILFGPPSLLIGMVSPHLAKIRVTSLETTGRSIGKLEAAGALGSIAGTFSCGYFLLGFFGSRSIIIGIVVLLIVTSFIVEPRFWLKGRAIGSALLVLTGLIINLNTPPVVADIDSSYARYQVVQRSYGGTPANMLKTDDFGIQSAIPADGSDIILFDYARRFDGAAKAFGSPENVLVIGGGAHTFPNIFAKNNPATRVDVVEIDPALEKLAKQYFFLKDSPNLTIYHADGRTYLNQQAKAYDIIYMDAFGSLSPPFQLTTQEAVQRIKKNLAPGGIVVANVIGSHQNGQGEYLRAVRQTYAGVFRHVAVTQAQEERELGDTLQNFIVYASDDKKVHQNVLASANPPLKFASGPGLVLTDNFAPVERLTF